MICVLEGKIKNESKKNLFGIKKKKKFQKTKNKKQKKVTFF